MDVDMVMDLDRGDCSKAKVCYHLLKNNSYSVVLKVNGSSNSGHTAYHNGTKIVTHLIPMGIYFNIKSIIGSNCVLNPTLFFEEMNSLQEQFSNIESLKHINLHDIVKIDRLAFIVEDKHIEEDTAYDKIGSTKKGVGPAYRDKYARIARQAKDVLELKPYLTDLYEEIKDDKQNILCEGSQGFYLDPNFTDHYPYCTSSHCTVGGALINGLPHTAIRDVYGVAKVYSTYVGTMKFQGVDPVFDALQKAGNEFGSTTNRKRQCNWLNMNELVKASFVNSITHLVLSKTDVFRELNAWKVRFNDGSVLDLKTEDSFKNYIIEVMSTLPTKPKILFSYSKHEI